MICYEQFAEDIFVRVKRWIGSISVQYLYEKTRNDHFYSEYLDGVARCVAKYVVNLDKGNRIVVWPILT